MALSIGLVANKSNISPAELIIVVQNGVLWLLISIELLYIKIRQNEFPAVFLKNFCRTFEHKILGPSAVNAPL